VKPLISRPILQAATPNAASLIARAPSTGVSQSSILAHKGEGRGGPETDPFKPPREKGRRAVFCDPITLPSPTSPNTPPIIHQPPAGPPTDPTSAAAGTVGRLITPTWSAPPLPTAATAQVCRLSPEKGGGGGVGVTTVVEADKPPTEISEKGGPSSSFSKLLSNVKRTPSLSDRHHHHPQEKKDDKPSTLPRKPKGGGGAARPERQSLRNLEISGPVLQSSVDHHARLHLIPCRSPELSSGEQTQSEENPAANSRQGSPSLKRPAPPPPSAKPSSAVVLPERKASIPNDDLSVSNTTKSKFSLPWRSVKPNRTETSSSGDTVPKSSSDDILEQKKGNELQSQPASSSSTRSGHHR
jgi:hypothetical protein